MTDCNEITKPGRRWRLLWPLLLLLPLLVLGCSEDILPVGKARQGDTLIISIDEIKRVLEVRFQGTDLQHYVIAPASQDNELIVIRLNVHNADATTVIMTVDEDAAQLRGFKSGEEYQLLNPDPETNVENIRLVEGPHPAEDRYVPFIRGPVDLPKGNSLIGWVVFEVPAGLDVESLRWDAGDTVFIRSR